MTTEQTSGGDGTKLQDPEVDIKPRVSGDQVPDLILRLYGLTASDIKTFPSYDDLNFYFKTQEPWDNPHISALNPHGYVLKVLNSLQSEAPEIIDAQDAFTSHLRSRGICTQEPILNKQGARWSLETFTSGQDDTKYGPYVVRILTFVPGDTFVNTPYVPGSFHNAGRFLGRFREAAKGFHHPFYDTYNTIWSLEQVSVLKDFLVAVKDQNDVNMVKDIIEVYEKEVKPLFEKFTKGTIHGDANEQNLLMREVPGQDNVPKNKRVHDVIGALDFADVTQSYNVMDVALTIAYLSIECPEEGQLDVGGHIVAGYLEESTLNDDEFSALRTLVCARLCQSLVYGAHSFMLQPENTYLLTTSAKGWPLLRKLYKTNADELYNRWNAIIKK